MNANDKFVAAAAHVDGAAVQPFPNSRKVYVTGSRPDIRVPMREIVQSDTPTRWGARKIHPSSYMTLRVPIPIRKRRSTCVAGCRRCANSGSKSATTRSGCQNNLPRSVARGGPIRRWMRCAWRIDVCRAAPSQG
jgi:hypothetical protein